MADEAKVRIGGDAAGATRATDQTKKGIKGVGDAAQETGKKIKESAEQGRQAEMKYEQEVQKAIQMLKKKETQANATQEAMKRLGKVPGSSMRDTISRLGPPPTVGGVGPAGIAQGLSKIGGVGGAAFGALGSSLSNAVPAVAALGVAAVGVKLGFDLITASGKNAAEAVKSTAEAHEKYTEAMKSALKQLGGNALAAAAAGGPGLKEAIAKGASVMSIKSVADRTGLSAEQSADIAAKIKDLTEGERSAVLKSASSASRLGVDPIKVVDELVQLRADSNSDKKDPNSKGYNSSAFSSEGSEGRYKGAEYLEHLSPEDLLRSAGNLFDNFSDTQLSAGINAGSAGRASDEDLNALGKLNAYGNRAGVAGLETLINPEAVKQADKLTASGAEAIRDPVGAAMKSLEEATKKEVDLLEKMAEANGKTNELLADIAASIKGGSGGYAGQADGIRKRSGGWAWR